MLVGPNENLISINQQNKLFAQYCWIFVLIKNWEQEWTNFVYGQNNYYQTIDQHNYKYIPTESSTFTTHVACI